MRIRGKDGLLKVIGHDIQNVFQNLFKQRGKWRRKANELMPYYTEDAEKASNQRKIIVCMFDGRMKHGGLVDRLRGIVSVYSICKKENLDFRIHFTTPFSLEDYLKPNKVDWRISPSDLSYNQGDSMPVFCGSNDTHVETPFQRLWLKQNFARPLKQVHVYTNAHLLRGKGFGPLFHELFTPVDKLQDAIKYHLDKIGGEYIAISSRFMALLGDFEDCNNTTLDTAARALLINRVIDRIKRIHSKHNCTVFIASDSVTFLKEAQKLDFVYIVSGSVAHVDYADGNLDDTWFKVFVDFFMLSHASKIYLLQTGGMYYTGFPRRAAQVGNVPLERITF